MVIVQGSQTLTKGRAKPEYSHHDKHARPLLTSLWQKIVWEIKPETMKNNPSLSNSGALNALYVANSASVKFFLPRTSWDHQNKNMYDSNSSVKSHPCEEIQKRYFPSTASGCLIYIPAKYTLPVQLTEFCCVTRTLSAQLPSNAPVMPPNWLPVRQIPTPDRKWGGHSNHRIHHRSLSNMDSHELNNSL